MNITLLSYALALLGSGFAQDPTCDYVQQVQPNQMYYVYSPNYPRNYTPGVQCRWIAVCPVGYNCKLDCSVINLPQSPSCSMDRLLISRTGDPLLTSAERYCGSGTLSVTSDGQRLSIGLITSYQSPGGRFYCTLTAQPAGVTPSTCQCGYKNMETGVNEFPMMAGVVYVELGQIKCGAVIISARHVMSAAHCVINRNINNLAVVVGEHDVTSGQSSTRQVFRVTNINVHPLYTTTTYDYDVSVLTVQQNIVFSARVGPVCLPFKYINNDFTGAKVTILGWGTLFPGGPTSQVLQKVDVDVISNSVCQNNVPLVTPQQMCTYTAGKDACQDDSGGPLLYTDRTNGLLYSVGIVSFGKSCASRSPGVNTRVTTILNWVVAVTQTDFCKK